jgi:hypothetical protein
MRQSRRSFEVFNLSLLDIVSCAFGAVVLLVLVSDSAENVSSSRTENIQELLEEVASIEKKVLALTAQLAEEKKNLSADEVMELNLRKEAASTLDKVKNAEKKASDLDEAIGGLALVESSLKSATVSQNTAKRRDDEVGGIPVDSDYVIFIVDTSGSMQAIWNRVSAQVISVLQIHPKVKGFQILNDNGSHLISGYAGKWIPDTPQRRKSIINVFKIWSSASNSSPVEGLEIALKRYAKPNISLSIYIFGDDYTGSSYGPVIDTLVKLNKNKITGKNLAKIHAVGFISGYSTNRFPILMREVTKLSGGTFLALPP